MTNNQSAANDVKGFQTMASSIVLADNYSSWIISRLKPYIRGSLLEIGTGHANFRKWLPMISDYTSVDIDEEVVRKAQAASTNEDVYIVADVADREFPGKAGRNSFDTVLCFNVLEHIRDDRAALENMMKVVKPGGSLLLLLPAFPCLYTEIDRLGGHYRRYRKKDILEITPDSGCKIEVLEYFNAIGGLGWWANKFMRHKDIDSDNVNFQVLFFDRYVLPVSRFVNIITRYFFGQSIICVLRKI